MNKPWTMVISHQDVRFASFQVIREIVDGQQFHAFVWPDEGHFTDDGKWVFNKEHDGYAPMIIDMLTAKVMLTVDEAFKSSDNRQKFRRFIAADRGSFARMVQISWNAVA
jgi:hypothetical protein